MRVTDQTVTPPDLRQWLQPALNIVPTGWGKPQKAGSQLTAGHSHRLAPGGEAAQVKGV